MSDYIQKENTGSMFKNKRKEKDTHPDYNGKGNFKGVDFEFSAWLKESKAGEKYMSIAFKEPYVKEGASVAHSEKVAEQANNEIVDDLPF